MYYRLKDNNIYDYADYEYANDCLFTDICTMKIFEENREIYIIENGQINLVEDPDKIIAMKRKEEFEKTFFGTSLGWIKRKVTMKNGSVKDFLSDLLLPIKAGMELGQNVEIITYKTPDFTKELTKEYLETLQENKYATQEFVQECLFQTVIDFRGVGGSNGI